MHNSRDIRKLVRDAIDYTENNISTVSAKLLSERYGISPDLFCYYFKKVTGKTFKHYHVIRRMEIAKFLLKKSDKSISEIAKYLCYSDNSNFTRFFMKFTGITPLKYRKRYLKEKKKMTFRK